MPPYRAQVRWWVLGLLLLITGPRAGFAFIVVYWSLANALHALARGVASFSLFRFCLGSGECGNYSGGVKVVAQWFPPTERALAMHGRRAFEGRRSVLVALS
jgi:ACS family hexuronate transporter-like MFS transporter